jgi:hypothetical protein
MNDPDGEVPLVKSEKFLPSVLKRVSFYTVMYGRYRVQ